MLCIEDRNCLFDIILRCGPQIIFQEISMAVLVPTIFQVFKTELVQRGSHFLAEKSNRGGAKSQR